jgi:hypothetical protein
MSESLEESAEKVMSGEAVKTVSRYSKKSPRE